MADWPDPNRSLDMMRNWYTRLAVVLCTAAFLITLPGCKKRESRKMRVHEETKTGEVHEVAPGEMQVE
jgi:hypothetical protein